MRQEATSAEVSFRVRITSPRHNGGGSADHPSTTHVEAISLSPSRHYYCFDVITNCVGKANSVLQLTRSVSCVSASGTTHLQFTFMSSGMTYYCCTAKNLTLISVI